ncbi:MAG TPA: exodeoxyribonuclease V subunit gamma [Chlamydiales bacterium]|nr:exodeoxyribonuclease V subunit gamma [Chlamydiales bacterium]
MSKLFLSHRLDLLAGHLANEIHNDGLGIFASRTIMVPNSTLKQWLFMQMANGSEEKAIAGCKIMTLQQALQASSSSYIDVFCALFQELEMSRVAEICNYLKGSSKRTVELADQLTRLSLRYGFLCPSLFLSDPNNLNNKNWQKTVIQALFASGKLRLSVPLNGKRGSIHCFGFDYLPPVIWQSFHFHAVYLFSPCRHYWEDVCTDREKKRLDRFWKKKGVSVQQRDQLEMYLQDAPPLLANLGMAGRETLKILDAFEWEIQEDYQSYDTIKNSTLSRLKERLLDFVSVTDRTFPEDNSIQVSKTGSSPLREIEHVRTSILQLVEKEGLQFSDIAVLAPDIQPYSSLIQLVFFDLPFKIFGMEIGTKSVFYQGLHSFFSLDLECDDLMDLFENPSFYRARDWDLETVDQMRKWASKRALSEECVLDSCIFLYPREQERRISEGNMDALEQFLAIHQSLKADLALLKHSRSLSDWAKWIAHIVEKYFSVDLSNEADAAAWRFFKQTLRELAQVDSDGYLFPFAPIQTLLKRSMPDGEMHASHLHATRFASLCEGAITPARALFLIGMDEESFPRKAAPFSLDLLQKEKIYAFNPIDQDRYLFLQAIFAAKDFLHMSYLHLSCDGHLVNPCPMIEELSRSLDAPMKEWVVLHSAQRIAPSLPSSSTSSFFWPENPSVSLPEGELTIPLSDLFALARHPWEFYLQRKLGIRFEKSDEISFSQQKAKLLKAVLQQPLGDLLPQLPEGICGEAIQVDLEETSKKWSHLMRFWKLSIEPASFKKSCRERKNTGLQWEFPAMDFVLTPKLRVKLVGEIKNFSTQGFIHTGNDHLEGLLRVWPECLATLVASGRSEIYCLKTGKIKLLDNPFDALKAFIYYYFLSLSAPSPLLCPWADSILRKGAVEWEKKIQDRLLKKSARFEDPVSDWVMARISLPAASRWMEHWKKELDIAFAKLITL